MRLMLLVALLLASPAAAKQGAERGIDVAHAWSRPAMQGRVGVAYMTIADQGAPDRLTGASSPVASRVELHESRVDHGVATMRSVASLAVVPGKPAVLAPSGYHLMLVGLKQPLSAGQSFPLTLDFAGAGAVTVSVTVAGYGANPAMDMTGMDMQHMGAMTHSRP